jgi:hypothetical protein
MLKLTSRLSLEFCHGALLDEAMMESKMGWDSLFSSCNFYKKHPCHGAKKSTIETMCFSKATALCQHGHCTMTSQ